MSCSNSRDSSTERVLSSRRPLQVQRSFSQDSNPPEVHSCHGNVGDLPTRSRDSVEDILTTDLKLTSSKTMADIIEDVDWVNMMYFTFLALTSTFVTLGVDVSPCLMVPAVAVLSVALFMWLKL